MFLCRVGFMHKKTAGSITSDGFGLFDSLGTKLVSYFRKEFDAYQTDFGFAEIIFA
jgi:hypothetical protein